METKIEKLINTSLFLNKLQKTFLRQAVQTVSEAKKMELIIILESEKTDISEILIDYLKKSGKEGMSKLKHMTEKNKKVTSKAKEKTGQLKEKSEMETLLCELNDT